MLILQKYRFKSAVLVFIIIGSLPASGSVINYLSGNNKENPNRFRTGIIPALAYDSDVGLRYGAVINIFDYRDMSYDKRVYNQHLLLRFTNTTAGSLQLQALLESRSIIDNSVTLIEASYLSAKKYDFYGFNGLNAIYQPLLTDNSSPLFRNRLFYAYERTLLRLRFDNQMSIGEGGLRMLTGITFNKYDTGSAGNSEEEADNEIYGRTLYDNYIEWGIISEDEKDGGIINLLALGFVYDTRNDLCYCTDGIWAEAVLLYSPGLIGKNRFTQLILTYRHHATTRNDRLTFSFRVSSQQNLGGTIPFYVLSTFYDSRLSQDGLGGAFNLRGALRNRIVAEGFITGSIETKVKFAEFNLFRQDFFISASLFYDNALVTQVYDAGHDAIIPESTAGLFFINDRQKLHHTFGVAAYIVFNKDNVISINYGVPLDRQNGHGGFYVGSSLIF